MVTSILQTEFRFNLHNRAAIAGHQIPRGAGKLLKRADRVVSKGVAHSFLKVLERVFFGIHWLKIPFLTVVAVSDLSDQVVLSAVAQEQGERIHRRIRHDPLTALINYSGAGICPGCAGRKINLSVYCMLMADRCD